MGKARRTEAAAMRQEIARALEVRARAKRLDRLI
jgi:hypothetical protein